MMARQALFVAILAALGQAAALADSAALEAARADQQRRVQAIKAALKAYVFVGGGGSGVLISEDGYILTNDHVAGGQHRWRVRTSDGVLRHALLIGTDPFGDLALLKVEGAKNLPFLRFGDSDKLKVGQPVIAIGNPFALSNIDERPTVTVGVVSALHRYNQNRYTDAIMTDAPLNPGNSGGPLITMDGRLVGINGQIRTRFEVRSNTGIGYAISINQVKNFLPALKQAKGGFVRHGYIPGIAPSRPESTLRPPRVMLVQPGSLAAKAGFKVGDRLLEIDGRPLKTTNRFFGLMLTYVGGTRIEVTVLRGEKRVKLPVKLEPLPIPGRADLGVSFLDVAGSASLVVNKVTEGSAAAKAGIQVGDRLVSMTGIPLSVFKPEQLAEILRRQFRAFARTGALVEVTVLRGKKPEQLVLEIARVSGEPQIGFSLGKVSGQEMAKVHPLTISEVQAGSMAAKAGLRPGDVIQGMDDKQAATVKEFEALVSKHRPGDEVELAFKRNGTLKVAKVRLGMKREMP